VDQRKPMTRRHSSQLLTRAAALGAATGLRSSVGLAALVARRDRRSVAVLSRPAARPIAAVGFGIELVLDKLPTTPSRLEPPGLAGRTVFAALAAVALARSESASPVPAAVLASAVALVAAKVGHDVRAALASRLPDAAVAVAEDTVAIGVAMWATR
jgi:uncharacterized membrane protein